MNESLIFQGKNVDLAIEKAVQQLQLDKKDIHIEIIDPGSERLFGLTKTKAKIIVSRIENDKSNQSEKELGWEDWLKKEIQDQPLSEQSASSIKNLNKEYLKGKAWVKNGSLYFQDTETKKPLLESPSKTIVLKNGVKINDKTYLTQGDCLSFDLETKAVETKWSIKVDQKNQKVTLTVNPGYYIVPFIEDHPPAETVRIQVSQHEQTNNQLTEKDIYDQLEKMKITEGIQHDKIKSACRSSVPESFVIAEGLLPKDGENGVVHFSIDIHEKTTPFSEKIDGRIDFRESIYIPSIKEGEVLGKIIDPTRGEDGISIYGELLKAKSGHPVKIKVGNGIEYMESEKQLIAMAKGRPKIEQLGQLVRVSILPKLKHHGDLQMDDGNIHFIGDVEITGHVNEHMTVDADGSAWIHKSAFHSSIQTRNSITVGGNAINCSLIAGKNSLIFEEIAGKLEPFIRLVEPLVKITKQLTATEKFQQSYESKQGLSPLIKALTETKFKELIPVTNQLVRAINQRQDLLERNWQTFAITLYKGFLVYHHNVFQTYKDLERVMEDAHHLMNICQSPSENYSTISLQYVMNSDIHCNGDVQIKGKGCVHTKIHSDGKVTIKGKAIGGRILGKQGVQINEAGTSSGVKTIIEVPFDQKIIIKEAMADVVIKVGHQQYIFKQDHTNICAHLDKEGGLLLY
ncbi:FapA family protein [Salipaludibacillus daqingensis]|uniref:FapA family protein n=1 Tax=Salipaludibacillus daqingensis TaxID=3041001 RepID=UPI0024746E9C|nr:FapA family protein [Salipaludibacillus daqingensis]